MAYADYIYRRESGIFYFRAPCQFGTTRFSLKTRSYREAKQKAAVVFSDLQRFGRVDMTKYDKNSYLGEHGGPWILPDAEKITYVREHLSEQIPADRADDNAFLIKMFDIFTEKKRAAESGQIDRMASEFFGISEPVEQAPISSGVLPNKPEQPITLSELIKDFIEARSGQWDTSQRSQAQTRLGLIRELLGGDTKVNVLKRKDFSNLVKNLQRLPARRSKKAYKNFNLAQLIQLDIPIEDRFGIKTLISIIELLCHLFEYAEYSEHVEKNVTKKLKGEIDKKVAKGKLDKVGYSVEELQRIVDHTWKKEKRDDRRFIPMIALYSGLRQSEICQLRYENVIQEEGVWFFNIDEVMNVKSKAGHRRVPVHSMLEQIGLLDYISSISAGSLWPRLKQDRHGRNSGAIQKWFSKINREHITADPSKTFHSLRHNVTTVLMNSGIQRHLYQKIIGHEHDEKDSPDKSVTKDYEGNIEPTFAKSIIEKIVYDLDFSRDE